MILVWNAATKTEHFIRRAAFATSESAFGFLVPTPSKPELAEAPDAAFDRFAEAIKPEVRIEHPLRLGSFFASALGAPRSMATGEVMKPADDVRVLGEQRVAGYDAAILEADDAQALATWLKANGFAARPEIAAWAEPYVAARWKITAFKLAARDPGQRAEATRYAVRMSFAAERPIFPFRTPEDQHAGGPGAGLLRIHFVGAGRAQGSVGAEPWPARVPYAAALGARAAALLEGVVPAAGLPADAWLTTFEDHAWPRAAKDDLAFAPSADASAVVPPPVIVRRPVSVPVELGIFPLALGLIVWTRLRRPAS